MFGYLKWTSRQLEPITVPGGGLGGGGGAGGGYVANTYTSLVYAAPYPFAHCS